MVAEGQFYYARHRGLWGVWRKGATVNGVSSSDFVKDCVTREQARDLVYSLNNWQK